MCFKQLQLYIPKWSAMILLMIFVFVYYKVISKDKDGNEKK